MRKLIFIVIIILINILNIGIIDSKINYPVEHELEKEIYVPDELSKEKEDNKFKTVKLSFVGDVTIGTDKSYGWYNTFPYVLEKENNDYDYFFKNVVSVLANDDLTIANLETTLTNKYKIYPNKKYNFKGKPEYASILKKGSIEVVDIANNHMHDYVDSLEDTLGALEENDIKYFGSDVFKYSSSDEIGYLDYEYKLIEEVKGIKIGFLGYKGWDNSKYVKDIIENDIKYMKDNANLIIVSFHWGREKVNYPIEAQVDLAKFSIDKGADLIVGHHPHVIQPIEKYNGKYIVYSLGNFCFGGSRNPADKDTFIFQIDYLFKGNKYLGENINIIPCSISSVENRNNFQPTILVEDEKERVLERIFQYSDYVENGITKIDLDEKITLLNYFKLRNLF